MVPAGNYHSLSTNYHHYSQHCHCYANLGIHLWLTHQGWKSPPLSSPLSSINNSALRSAEHLEERATHCLLTDPEGASSPLPAPLWAGFREDSLSQSGSLQVTVSHQLRPQGDKTGHSSQALVPFSSLHLGRGCCVREHAPSQTVLAQWDHKGTSLALPNQGKPRDQVQVPW